jgi:thiol:disulfide interchange protein DsbA
MARLIVILFALIAVVWHAETRAAQTWEQGRHYVLLPSPQRTSVPAGKVEVLEVFSYGCIACNSFQPALEKLKASLPPNAEMAFLHASFNKVESWPMFQRAFYTAQAMGIAERTHQAMYDAIWKSGELAVADSTRRQLKKPQPTLEDAARFYERTAAVKPELFMATAKSFGVETKIRAADAQVLAMQVPGTPCLVVNGKYRIELASLTRIEELPELVRYLIDKESGR